MKNIIFKNFEKEDFNTVCEFLIHMSKQTSQYMNWNWARWEWMYFHPDFKEQIENKIGLWYSSGKLIALATFDFYEGESVFIVDPNYRELEDELISYSLKNYVDVDGLGIAVNDTAKCTISKLTNRGFVKDNNIEKLLCLDLEHSNLSYNLQEEYELLSLKGIVDAPDYNKVLWSGMDHEGEAPADEETYRKTCKMLSAKDINYDLNVYIKSRGEWIAFCSCFYRKEVDYAYVEPVCTVPEYRGRGLGSIVVKEALRRCRDLGAKKAYVISESDFYKKLGFKEFANYTFYWKK